MPSVRRERVLGEEALEHAGRRLAADLFDQPRGLTRNAGAGGVVEACGGGQTGDRLRLVGVGRLAHLLPDFAESFTAHAVNL